MHRASPSPSARQRKPLSFGNEVWQRILKLSLPYPYFSLPHQRKPVLSVKIFRVWLKEKYYRLNIAVRVCRFYFIKRNVGGLDNRSNSIHPYFLNRSSQSATLFETTPPPPQPRTSNSNWQTEFSVTIPRRQKRPTPSMYLHPPWYQCN